MRCHKCGSRFREVPGPLQFSDPYIGYYTADIEEYQQCEGCGEKLIPAGKEEARKIDEARTRTLEQLLREHRLREFVTAPEAAKILGITRQAFHKHRRIRRGFIFGVRFGRGMLYLRESVERFKGTGGDGRFPLRTFLLMPSVETDRPVREFAEEASAWKEQRLTASAPSDEGVVWAEKHIRQVFPKESHEYTS